MLKNTTFGLAFVTSIYICQATFSTILPTLSFDLSSEELSQKNRNPDTAETYHAHFIHLSIQGGAKSEERVQRYRRVIPVLPL